MVRVEEEAILFDRNALLLDMVFCSAYVPDLYKDFNFFRQNKTKNIVI
uniref:Uncharacterized protein n=1 Tax=viral metagenome TaxID=1070528 RepID=A0A6C0BB07_9ZZZZ